MCRCEVCFSTFNKYAISNKQIRLKNSLCPLNSLPITVLLLLVDLELNYAGFRWTCLRCNRYEWIDLMQQKSRLQSASFSFVTHTIMYTNLLHAYAHVKHTLCPYTHAHSYPYTHAQNYPYIQVFHYQIFHLFSSLYSQCCECHLVRLNRCICLKRMCFWFFVISNELTSTQAPRLNFVRTRHKYYPSRLVITIYLCVTQPKSNDMSLCSASGPVIIISDCHIKPIIYAPPPFSPIGLFSLFSVMAKSYTVCRIFRLCLSVVCAIFTLKLIAPVVVSCVA